ncbi:MAG: biosynthetic peptidoglycan transglycosylase [Gemmatimonadaceae bacterium]
MLQRAGSRSAPVGSAWIPLTGVAPILAAAVIAAEDPTFPRHRGIVWRQTAIAICRHFARGDRIGGTSSISQQLVRNLYLSSSRTLKRKASEVILTLVAEATLEKARILELYLNIVEWGPGVWGLAHAAAYYFRRPPHLLSPFESVFLASLLPAPQAPLTGANARRAAAVQTRITNHLYGSGYISSTTDMKIREQFAALYQRIGEGVTTVTAARESGDSCDRFTDPPRAHLAGILLDEGGPQARASYYSFLSRGSSVLGRRPRYWPDHA